MLIQRNRFVITGRDWQQLMLPGLAVGALGTATLLVFGVAAIVDASSKARGPSALRAAMLLAPLLLVGPKTLSYVGVFGSALALNCVAWWLMAVRPRLDGPPPSRE